MTKIDDRSITDRLSEIRRQVGGKQVVFFPRPPNEPIDVDIPGDSLRNIFHSSGLLIHNGRPVFAYIRDHTNLGSAPNLTPQQCKKIHFRVCQTLRSMKQQGRFDRYRVTNRDDDRYYIDVRKGWYDTEERQVRLFPCQNCLAASGYRCFSYSMGQDKKDEIIEHFNAKDAFALLWQQFDIFRMAMSDVQPATLPTGYPRKWNEFSKRIRRLRNFTCEKCGVRLERREFQGCLDVHHKNADKRNNRDDNLICLCKLCHKREHPHYRVALGCQEIIMGARRQQSIM